MDGTIANLKGICDLAENMTLVMWTTRTLPFIGMSRSWHAGIFGVQGRIDVIGNEQSARRSQRWLHQRAEGNCRSCGSVRGRIFFNTVAPPIVAVSLKALELLAGSTELRDKLEENTKYFRTALTERGLTIRPGTHPIVPIMLGDAALSQKFAARMLEKGVYVIGFFYPVVPHGTARVRTRSGRTS
jgi:glycine C-acetyltransferase